MVMVKVRKILRTVAQKIILVLFVAVLMDMPLGVYAADDYLMICEGDWTLLEKPDAQAQMQFVFSQVYPRLAARWGRKDGHGQSIVRVQIIYDETVGGYTSTVSGDVYNKYVVIGVPDNNKRKDGLAVLVHELGHVAECYVGFQSDWWTEALAEYGVWRYFTWTEPQFVTLSDNGNLYNGNFLDDSWKDWGWEKYGRAELFFTYLDSKYPTTMDASGKKIYGLIDAVNYAIQDGKIHNDKFDNPEFNAVVQAVTGLGNMELLRQQFVLDLEQGTWSFHGFSGYPDNFITENLQGVKNPSYPGRNGNLCLGATIFRNSGATSEDCPAVFVADGDLSTKWSATAKSANRADEWLGRDAQHYVILDLGNEVTLDTYAIYHAGIHEEAALNTARWNVLYWDRAGQEWKFIDTGYWNASNDNITTRKFPPVTTQYMFFELLDANKAGTGEANIYEIVCLNSSELELGISGQ